VPGLVDKELRKLFGHVEALMVSLKNYVMADAIKGFAILIQRNHGVAIKVLKDAGYKDSHLPIDINYFSDHAFSNAGEHTWPDTAARYFCLDQWKVLAPVFGKDGDNSASNNHLVLDERRPLPYIELGTTIESTYGTVHQLKIHPLHHNFPCPVRTYFCPFVFFLATR